MLCAVLTMWITYINRSWTEEDVERAKVNVEQCVCFSLIADGKEVAYFSRFSEQDSILVGLTTRRDSALVKRENVGVWVNSTSLFPSANGLVLAVDEEARMEKDVQLMSGAMRAILERNRQQIAVEKDRAVGIADELDYYLSRHNIFDNEYIGVANYTYGMASEQRHLEQMLVLLDSLAQHATRIEVKVNREYFMGSLQLFSVDSFWKRPSLLHMRSNTEDVRFVVLKSDSLTEIPDSCKAFSTPLFVNNDFSDMIYEWKVRFHHLNYHSPLIEDGALTALDFYRYIEYDTLFVGASIDTLSNHYSGTMTEGGVPQGYGEMRYGNGDYYEGEWKDGKKIR